MSTIVTDVNLINSTVEGTPIGQNTPAAVRATKVTADAVSGTGGGYSFAQDGGQDTGMFSDADGRIVFLNNSVSTEVKTPTDTTFEVPVKVPTAASSENSTIVANTAWCLFGLAVSLNQNGYIKFPTWMGGLIIQWGVATLTGGTTTASFNITFPNVLFMGMCNIYSGDQGNIHRLGFNPVDGSTFHIICDNSSPGSSPFASWIAIGA